VIPLLPVHDNALASKTLVEVETVNSYTPCFGGGDLYNANQSGVNFYTELLRVNSLGFQINGGGSWQDAWTWNTDYLDPDTPNAPPGSMDYAFGDAPNMAISFFQGHGIQNLSDDRPCTSVATCTTYQLPATCESNPWTYQQLGQGKGACMYATPRALVTCGNRDAGSATTPIHYAYLTGPNMVLGENPSEGGWRGAGTNGGTSLAIFHISQALNVWFPNTEWKSMFGGIHMVAGLLLGWGGDTADSLGFGNAVASPYSTNPNGPVAQSYANAISSITDGTGCWNGYSYTGGINGCGCHVVIAYGNTLRAPANTLNHEPWAGLTSDQGGTATSTAYSGFMLGCNYNVAEYFWSGTTH
jgi:hypothetical protein